MHIRISSYRGLSLIVVLVPLVVIRTLLVGVVRALLGGAVRALLGGAVQALLGGAVRALLGGAVRALLGGAVRALLAVILVFWRLGRRGHAHTVTPHRIDQLLEDLVV